MSAPASCENKVNLPYPAVQAGEVNLRYARAMLSNVGGRNSEMNAVSLYFYNSLVTKKEYESFATCFHSISIVEMHHLDIFGELALQLGADPRLWGRASSRYIYWSPGYNQYPREIKALLRNAIDGEQAAIRKYSEQAQTIQNANIVENLKRIILDEQHHIEIFESMYAMLSK